MRARWFVLSGFAALAVMAGAAVPTEALAATARASGVLPIHSGPANGYPIIGRLAQNERVEVVRCTWNSRWCYVAGSGQTGWVLGSYLVGSAAKLRATPPKPLVDPFRHLFGRHHRHGLFD